VKPAGSGRQAKPNTVLRPLRAIDSTALIMLRMRFSIAVTNSTARLCARFRRQAQPLATSSGVHQIDGGHLTAANHHPKGGCRIRIPSIGIWLSKALTEPPAVELREATTDLMIHPCAAAPSAFRHRDDSQSGDRPRAWRAGLCREGVREGALSKLHPAAVYEAEPVSLGEAT